VKAVFDGKFVGIKKRGSNPTTVMAWVEGRRAGREAEPSKFSSSGGKGQRGRG
jgi:hypothetical protein